LNRIVRFIRQQRKIRHFHCLSRKVEAIAEVLQGKWWLCRLHHAGLMQKRAKHQDMFLMEDVDVVVGWPDSILG
jgi:ATP-dependent DNA helicase RecQ